jgi:hypothetical protein
MPPSIHHERPQGQGRAVGADAEPHPASWMTLRYVARTFVGDEFCSGAKVLPTPNHVNESFTAAMVVRSL